MSNVAYTSRVAAPKREPEATRSRLLLLLDLVRALASFALGRFDLLASLLSQGAHEAAHRVRLPARCFHDLG